MENKQQKQKETPLNPTSHVKSASTESGCPSVALLISASSQLHLSCAAFFFAWVMALSRANSPLGHRKLTDNAPLTHRYLAATSPLPQNYRALHCAPLVAGRPFFFVLAGACQFGTAWVGLRLIHHHQLPHNYRRQSARRSTPRNTKTHPRRSFWFSPRRGVTCGRLRIWLRFVGLNQTPVGAFFLEVRPGSEMAGQNRK